MKILPGLRKTTTVKISQTLVDIATAKKISIYALLRSTFQLVYVIDKHYHLDINNTLNEIIEFYKPNEYKSLSSEGKLIKTFRTKNQEEAFTKIKHQQKTYFINELISIVINNTKYYNLYSKSQPISSHYLMNQLTIDFFICITYDSYLPYKLTIIENLIVKTDFLLKNEYLTSNFFSDIFIEFFDDKEIIQSYEIAKFLRDELEKLYFVMLKLYKIPISSKSSSSLARCTIKKYSQDLQKIYNNNICDFLINAIKIDYTCSYVEEQKFINFLCQAFSIDQEKDILKTYLLNYVHMSPYIIQNEIQLDRT